VNFLQGTRYRNQTADSGSVGYLSLEGGAELFIDGSGYESFPSGNDVKMLMDDVAFGDNPFVAPVMSSDDEFSSSTMTGALAFTTPSIETVFGLSVNDKLQTAAWEHLADGDVSYVFTASVNADDVDLACTSASKCQVKYSSSYTARLYDVIPNQVYNDQKANFMINPVATKYALNDDMEPIQSIKIDGTNVDWEGLMDNSYRTPDWTVDDYPAYIGDQKASKDSKVVVKMRGGNAMNLGTSTHCTWDSTECWTLRTHPKIDSISADTGYTTGGQEMTLTGTGLSGTTAEVMVDGVACVVTSNTETEIKCVTGEAAGVSTTGVRQPNVQGLRSEYYDPSGNSYIDINQLKARTANYIRTDLLTQFEPIHDSIWRAGRAMSGYFKAPATGNFRFLLACEDSCYL